MVDFRLHDRAYELMTVDVFEDTTADEFVREIEDAVIGLREHDIEIVLQMTLDHIIEDLRRAAMTLPALRTFKERRKVKLSS